MEKFNLFNDLGFVKTGVEEYQGEKNYFSTGSIKGDENKPEGKYKFKNKPSRANRLVEEGDILQARMQNTQKAIIIDKNLSGSLFSTGFFQLRPPKDLICTRYIYYYLQTKWFNNLKDGLCSGATQKSINDTKLKEINFFLPSYSEQKIIADKLDKVFVGINDAIRMNEASLANLDNLFSNSVEAEIEKLKENFPTGYLNDVVDGVQYGTSFKCKKNGKYPVLRMGNIQDGDFDFDDLVYLDDESESKKYRLNQNDVLFNRTNSPLHVGKSAMFKSDIDACFAGYLIRINYKKSKVNPEFLSYYLNSPSARNYGYSVMSSSVNQANINGEKLKKYPFVLANINEQEKISLKLRKIKEKVIEAKKIKEKKQRKLISLKSAILAKELKCEAL